MSAQDPSAALICIDCGGPVIRWRKRCAACNAAYRREIKRLEARALAADPVRAAHAARLKRARRQRNLAAAREKDREYREKQKSDPVKLARIRARDRRRHAAKVAAKLQAAINQISVPKK